VYIIDVSKSQVYQILTEDLKQKSVRKFSIL